MFQYPYGDSQQLNLDWLMEQWQETKVSIDGSLQGEIDRVEAAITDLLTARDQAVAAKTAAESAATSAAGYAGTASGAASTATAQAAAAAASAALAGNHASNAQTSETNAGLQAMAAGNSASAAATSATNARNSELAAAASSSAAAGNALYAEGMAKGTQNGTPVTSGSPYYEDNSAYWAGEAQVHASNAVAAAYYSEAMAKGTVNGTPVASGEPGYEDNAEYYKDQAAAQAAAAAASAASADGAAAQAMIAQVEASSTASAAHAAGTYFRLNGVLYMATQDIAVGATITPGTNCSVAVLGNDVSELKTAITALTDLGTLTFNDGIFNASSQRVETYSGYKYTKIPVSIYCGGYMKGITGITPNNIAIGLSFVDEYDVVLATHYSTNTGSYKYEYNVQVPSGSIYVYINLRTASESLWVNPEFNLNVVFDNLQEIGEIKTELIETTNKINNIYNPILRNGSIGNSASLNAVGTRYILPIETKYDFVEFEYIGDISSINKYAFTYTVFKNATDGMTSSAAMSDSSITKTSWNSNEQYKTNLPYIRIPIGDINQYDHIAVALFAYDDSGEHIPLRIATSQYCLKIIYGYNQEKGISTKLNNARHIKGNSSTPLTILHFSDIHADVNAMNRILTDARNNNASIDQMICTGDIVNNSAEQISSWWNENVLTCIGNHDSASYSGGVYDWTALSMADRDAYYIAPFESNWGITHTSGTSYYYKDYATQKVRLIVMDGMLYIGDTTTTEAAAQTAWLENLLADAITSNLHVLIAIHAPHGGATAEECSFSKYGQTAMPTLTDCNTPQAVIDAVATKITAGLKFIGYICGHTHQDNIWDAENDGKQLMYCITCAIVSNANLWKDSDQNRSTFEDAYNLVTIDTANTLVKIVRGGGADIDDHMRTRKAICFNYSTGEKVGEVL